MSIHDPRGLHSATFGDIRRLLVCLNDLHAAPASVRSRRLASALLDVLAASAATVCVADGEAWTVVAAERVGRASVMDRVTDWLRPPEAFVRGAVELTGPDDDGPAIACSVRVDDGLATALVARRPEAFEPKHALLLELLHPHIVWALAASLATRNLPPGSEPVLELLLVGLPEKEIAQRLNRSMHTVHGHVKRLYRHFEVSSKSQLIHHHNQRGDAR